MALLSPADEQKLREDFSAITRPVHLLFFTQTFGCDTCLDARQILDELPRLSRQITIDEVNLVIDRERAAAWAVDRAPSIAVAYEDEAGALQDTRMRFVGTPAGYEFLSLVDAVLLAGGRGSGLSSASRARLAEVDVPVTLHVFTTPTCPHCPSAVRLAHEMAAENPHIHAYAVEATEFPDLVRQFRVTGVPKTVVNDTIEILGALPEDAFVEQALAGLGSPPDEAGPRVP